MLRKMIAFSTLVVLMAAPGFGVHGAFAQPQLRTASVVQSAEGASLHVDSKHGEPVDIYVDQVFKGTVAAYGDLYVQLPAGAHTLRCNAHSGYSYRQYVYMEEGTTFTWTLLN